MPGYLLHEEADVQCVHVPPGQAKPTVPNQRVKVGGKKIVTQLNLYTISRCGLPPQSGGPCVTAQWTSAASRVKAGGLPVLLSDSQALCAPTNTGLKIVSTQTRVKGI